MKTMIATLTSKGQTTIPVEVRRMLKLSPGDKVAFRVQEGKVELARARPLDIEFAGAVESTLSSEWLCEEDDKAYGNL